MSKMTGAEIVIECLKEQGVDTVFGYPGGAILNIYDALYRHQDEITHILTSHEQGASHAADGYARATGKVGVCLATSGPGATNLVTGIATAQMDSIPVVAITCNVGVSLLGKDSFQEIDIAGVTMPITKYNFIVKDVTKLAATIRRAFTIARSGRPGPVLIDITKDVTAAEYDYEYQAPEDECLKEQGVDTVFGYPGGAILNIYDALYRHQDEITHILTSHEQGASHAADGYARATGKVGVCLATSGPGATNLVTGIATAQMDSIPVVAITCNVGVSLLGKDSFQEIDIAGVTMPITKYNFIVKDVTKLAATIRRAFTIARSGRPGPVLIDITKDVTAAEYDYEYQAPEEISPQTDTITEEDIEKALELIRNSQKPFIFAGGGAVISNASDELKAFAHKIQAPVADSLMGKGAFDGTDPLYTGMVGMHGTKTSNFGFTECDLLIVVGARFSDRVIGNASKFAKNAKADSLMGKGAFDGTDPLYTGMVGMHGTKTSNFGFTECDLLIVVGARFSDRVIGNASKFAKNAKILQIDVDAAEINKNIQTYASVIGDAKVVLRKLNARLDPMNQMPVWIL